TREIIRDNRLRMPAPQQRMRPEKREWLYALACRTKNKWHRFETEIARDFQGNSYKIQRRLAIQRPVFWRGLPCLATSSQTRARISCRNRAFRASWGSCVELSTQRQIRLPFAHGSQTCDI